MLNTSPACVSPCRFVCFGMDTDSIFYVPGEEKIRNSVIEDRDFYLASLLSEEAPIIELKKMVLYAISQKD